MTYTAEQCLQELRDLTATFPDKIISRNLFRQHSQISEREVNKHFGTFSEFKRQAGILETKTSLKLLNATARHASVDHLRDLDRLKADWSGKYLNPNTGRFKTILTIGDIHDKDSDEFTISMFLEAIKRVKPDRIVLNGDTFDLPEFSRFTKDPRTWDLAGRILWVHDFLAKIRKIAPDVEIFQIEGNHSLRLMNYMHDESPAILSLLGDVHQMTIPELLGLDKFKVNYVGKASLLAFTASDTRREMEKNYMVHYDCFITHHFPEGEKLGLPGVNGHHHSYYVRSKYNETYGSYQWIQMGGACKRHASYTDAAHGWNNGFMITHIDTVDKTATNEYVDTTNAICVLGGKYYERDKV